MPQKSAEAQICYPSMTITELEFDQSSRHLKYSILEQRLSTRFLLYVIKLYEKGFIWNVQLQVQKVNADEIFKMKSCFLQMKQSDLQKKRISAKEISEEI